MNVNPAFTSPVFVSICIQEKIFHSHDGKSFIIAPRFFGSIDNDNFLE